VIGPAEAPAHVGRIARVEGRLARTHRTEKAVFLVLERAKPNNTATSSTSDAIVFTDTGELYAPHAAIMALRFQSLA